jgi:hypothetical protein
MKDIEDKKAEDMNDGFDEITHLFMEAEARKQLKLKKQKRNFMNHSQAFS